jgi:hypothetical protein
VRTARSRIGLTLVSGPFGDLADEDLVGCGERCRRELSRP